MKSIILTVLNLIIIIFFSGNFYHALTDENVHIGTILSAAFVLASSMRILYVIYKLEYKK